MELPRVAPTDLPTFPAELKRIQLRSRRLVTGDLLGQYRSAFRGAGLVFTDLREYQPGDDVKHIHWKATARTGTVYVKSYEEDRQLRVILAVDTSASMRAFGSGGHAYTKAVEFCAAVGALTQRGNDLLGLALFSDGVSTFLPPASGPKRYQSILTTLLNQTPTTASTNLAATATYLTTHARRAGVLFIVSDFVTPPFDRELRALSVKHDVVLVQIESRFEALRDCGLVSCIDSETGERVVIDTNSRKVRAALEESLRQRREQLRQLARACRADHIVISESATAPLIQLMKERATGTKQ